MPGRWAELCQWARALVGMVLLLWPGTAAAQAVVDLELILAIDASDSVNRWEYALQIDGMAAAFQDPAVVAAIEGGPNKAIAVTVIEWSGRYQQQIVLPWMRIDGAEPAAAFARSVSGLHRTFHNGVTSISGILDYASQRFDDNDFEGYRRVIDISSDGRQNQGRRLQLARQDALERDLTINALAILAEMPDLDVYFKEEVIGGFGAFVEVAKDYRVYAEAIRRKLLREISTTPIGAAPPPSQEQVAALPRRAPPSGGGRE
ncbi:MAG: DUF1194 domain-containing protein [Alphaproteobacteria bacterium]|nr:DUF1194 domain-containing protein [Alphaproteobacteria bacterium]